MVASEAVVGLITIGLLLNVIPIYTSLVDCKNWTCRIAFRKSASVFDSE